MKMESQIQLIPVEQVIPNRFQPRTKFDNDGITELAESIRVHGMIQPVIIRRLGPKFEIIAGERRFRAAQVAGMKQVPCIICELDDNEAAELAIIENTHRMELNPIEEARGYKRLLDKRYVTQDKLAMRLGMSQSALANKIRLLSLDESVQDALMNNQISEGHARSLLKVTDKMKQVDLLNKIIAERWNVRHLDGVIDEIINGYNKPNVVGEITADSKLDVDVDDIINNSIDIDPGIATTYEYRTRAETRQEPKKNSLFFNNLENESANMDPNISFGFNPFQTKLEGEEEEEEVDYDLLEPDENVDANDEVEKTETTTSTEVKKAQPEVIEDYETVDDTIAGFKKIIRLAKANGINIEIEEFNFDLFYQFILRIDKEVIKKEDDQ